VAIGQIGEKMSEIFVPFDAGAGSGVTEAQWTLMMRQAAICNGYIPTLLNELLVYADSTGMQVKVKTGGAWIMGHFYRTDAELVKSIAASDPTNPRWDIVVARLDWVNNLISIAVVSGTPAGSPTVPAVTQSASTWEIKLAKVYVAAGVSTIASTVVYDQRIGCFGSYEIEYVIGNGLTVPVTGVLPTGIKVPWPGRIDCWTLENDAASGNIVLDLWKDTFTNYPPTVADTIITAGKPTLSSARKNSGYVWTGSGTPASQWPSAVLGGPCAPDNQNGEPRLLINIDSCSVTKQALLTLRVQKHPFWTGW
jgi:hypothetical protein